MSALSPRTTALVSGGLLLAAVGVVALLFLTEPEAQQEMAVKETAMLVEVVTVELGTFRPTIRAMGAARPARDVTLQPRVTGEVLSFDPAFNPGGFVAEGQVLLRIDPADYVAARIQAEGALAQARAELALEMGRQGLAQAERDQAQGALSPEQEALVLRSPQLKAAEAQVKAAEAALQRAELDLARATVRAPFDAHVLSRAVSEGSQVRPGDTLGRLVGLDTWWVEAAVPVSALRQLSVPTSPDVRGPEARLRDRAAWGADEARVGHVQGLVNSLDAQARVATLLVAVEDPLAREGGGPPLMAGAWMELQIEGEPIAGAARLERRLLRKGDTVWVMDDGALDIRPVELAWAGDDFVYITGGLEAGEQVVATDLATVRQGAKLRTEGAP